MLISFFASVRSPPATRKFSTGNATAVAAPATGNSATNSNLSPPARNRSRSRSPAAQRKTNVSNISPEPSHVSFIRDEGSAITEKGRESLWEVKVVIRLRLLIEFIEF